MSFRFWFVLALVALPAVAGATTHTVTQNGITFEPADLTIAPGDTVMWVQTAGAHTVTHGLDDTNPPLGEKLFDAPLNTAEPMFMFTFPDAGDFPYYCRPHRTLGMTGVIHVEGATSVDDGVESESWAEVKQAHR